MKRILALAILGLVAFAQGDAIDDYLKAEMSRLHIPAVAFAIIKDNRLIRKEAIGLADIEAKRELKESDLFEIGSLTKQFTAMGVLMLVESEKIGLDDSISKYLPDVPSKWSAVKVRNLLNQDSGIPEYSTVPGVGMMDKYTRAQFMDTMGKLPLDFDPGVAWAYSNTNYALLGWIVEEVTKEPYTKFIEENILWRVGMTHSSFAELGVQPTDLVKGYLLRRRGPVPIPRGGASIKSDGGLISNLPDMIRWDEALSSLRLLTRKSYQLMWGRAKLNSGRYRSYGMGWYMNIPGTGTYLGHGGNSAGFSAGVSRFPSLRLTVIVMTNLYGLSGEDMTKQIALLFDPSLKPTPFAEVPDPDAKRTERVKLAIGALAANNPDETLLEPETSAPMKSARAKLEGPGPWGALKSIDAMIFGGSKPQGADTMLTYRVRSGPRSFLVMILWSAADKLAQATIYEEPELK